MKSYIVEVDLKDGQRLTEKVKAKNMIKAHHIVYQKHKGNYAASIAREVQTDG